MSRLLQNPSQAFRRLIPYIIRGKEEVIGSAGLIIRHFNSKALISLFRSKFHSNEYRVTHTGDSEVEEYSPLFPFKVLIRAGVPHASAILPPLAAYTSTPHKFLREIVYLIRGKKLVPYRAVGIISLLAYHSQITPDQILTHITPFLNHPKSLVRKSAITAMGMVAALTTHIEQAYSSLKVPLSILKANSKWIFSSHIERILGEDVSPLSWPQGEGSALLAVGLAASNPFNPNPQILFPILQEIFDNPTSTVNGYCGTAAALMSSNPNLSESLRHRLIEYLGSIREVIGYAVAAAYTHNPLKYLPSLVEWMDTPIKKWGYGWDWYYYIPMARQLASWGLGMLAAGVANTKGSEKVHQRILPLLKEGLNNVFSGVRGADVFRVGCAFSTGMVAAASGSSDLCHSLLFPLLTSKDGNLRCGALYSAWLAVIRTNCTSLLPLLRPAIHPSNLKEKAAVALARTFHHFSPCERAIALHPLFFSIRNIYSYILLLSIINRG